MTYAIKPLACDPARIDAPTPFQERYVRDPLADRLARIDGVTDAAASCRGKSLTAWMRQPVRPSRCAVLLFLQLGNGLGASFLLHGEGDAVALLERVEYQPVLDFVLLPRGAGA
jgi:hypothetical protein